MYSSDTFHHLSTIGQIGLVIVSTVLAIITLWCFQKISSRFPRWVKVLIAIAIFWIFLWLSPQAYYAYYWFLFDGLPLQVVVRWPPGPMEILKISSLTGKQTLSAHAQAILFWLLIAVALLGHLNPCRFRKLNKNG